MQIKQFTPIFKEILKQEQLFPFNIYKELDDNSFLLIQIKDTPIVNVDELLVVETLYIKTEDKIYYKELLEKHVNSILTDSNINIDKKTSFVNQIASNTMQTLFEEKISIKNVRKASSVSDNIVNLMLKDNKAMYSMLKVTSYDYNTYSHCVDVASYCIGFGVFLGLSKEELIVLGKAGMLHDIGKKEIDKKIIGKKGPLTFEEFEIVKHHPALGVKSLRLTGVTNKTLLTIVEQHHEKCDGSGYPKGLKDDEIHDLAKILTICDIFDALTTKRAYKERMPSYHALNFMFTEMYNQLSPKYLREFARFMQGELSNIKKLENYN